MAYNRKKGSSFMRRLIINGNEVYEVDEKCLREKKKQIQNMQNHNCDKEKKIKSK